MEFPEEFLLKTRINMINCQLHVIFIDNLIKLIGISFTEGERYKSIILKYLEVKILNKLHKKLALKN